MKIQIEFECGEKTCAYAPGKFCRFLKTSHFGTRYQCSLFVDEDRLPVAILEGEDGWLQRCEECLELNGE